MKSYPFTPDMKKLPVEQLFDCMAAKLVEFAHECGQDPTATVAVDMSKPDCTSHLYNVGTSACVVKMTPLQLSVLLVKQGKDAPVVGFCFSFPVDQTTVNSGRIIVWTKGGPRCPA